MFKRGMNEMKALKSDSETVRSTPIFEGSGFRVKSVPRMSLWRGLWIGNRKVDITLLGKGNSNSHGARPVHLIISMIK